MELHGFLSSVGLTNSAFTCSALMKLDERCRIGTLGEHQDKCEHIKIILADGHLSAVDSGAFREVQWLTRHAEGLFSAQVPPARRFTAVQELDLTLRDPQAFNPDTDNDGYGLRGPHYMLAFASATASLAFNA